MDILAYTLARMKEPSTWAGIAAACAVTGQVFPSIQHSCWAISLYASALAAFLRENPQ